MTPERDRDPDCAPSLLGTVVTPSHSGLASPGANTQTTAGMLKQLGTAACPVKTHLPHSVFEDAHPGEQAPEIRCDHWESD